jgi:hypothetical protein
MKSSRASWSNDHKYLVKTSVALLQKTNSGLFNLALTSIVVFEGDPDLSLKAPLFLSSYQVHIDDIDGELAEAERVGHAFIAWLR